jgi:hypothetical protein
VTNGSMQFYKKLLQQLLTAKGVFIIQNNQGFATLISSVPERRQLRKLYATPEVRRKVTESDVLRLIPKSSSQGVKATPHDSLFLDLSLNLSLNLSHSNFQFAFAVLV